MSEVTDVTTDHMYRSPETGGALGAVVDRCARIVLISCRAKFDLVPEVRAISEWSC